MALPESARALLPRRDRRSRDGRACVRGPRPRRRPPRTVLSIHWGPEDFPANFSSWTRRFARPDVARDDAGRLLRRISRDRDFSVGSGVGGTRDYIRRKFEGRQIDVVIAMTTAGARSSRSDNRDGAVSRRADCLRGGRRAGGRSRSQRAGVTGVVQRCARIAETLELALQLHPSVKRVFVVAQSPSQGYDEESASGAQRFSAQVAAHLHHGKTVRDLLAAVKARPREHSPDLCTARYSRRRRDARLSDEVARHVAEASPVPVYGTGDLYIGTGVVGGMMRRHARDRRSHRADGAADSRRHAAAGHSDRRTAARADLRLAADAALGHRPVAAAAGSRNPFQAPTVWETYRRLHRRHDRSSSPRSCC